MLMTAIANQDRAGAKALLSNAAFTTLARNVHFSTRH